VRSGRVGTGGGRKRCGWCLVWRRFGMGCFGRVEVGFFMALRLGGRGMVSGWGLAGADGIW
jgi:hypothetical protein